MFFLAVFNHFLIFIYIYIDLLCVILSKGYFISTPCTVREVVKEKSHLSVFAFRFAQLMLADTHAHMLVQTVFT